MTIDDPTRARVPWWACALLAAAFTAIMVQKSLGYGHLLIIPTQDDITYLADAAWRVQKLYVHGVDSFVKSFFTEAPHSPYLTLSTVAAFLLMGIHDWAPYVLNGVNVFFALLAVRWAVAPLSRTGFALLAVVLLTLPASGTMVLQHRPDVVNGLFTATAMIAMLRLGVEGDRRSALVPGALFGLSLMTKPSVFMMTLVLFAGVAGWWLIRSIFIERAARGRSLRRVGVTLAATAVTAGWWYLLNWRTYWDYFYSFLFGDKSGQTESLTGDLGFHLGYYLTGFGGWFMFGHLLIALLVLVMAGGVGLVLIRDRARLWLLAQATGPLLVAYAIPTVTHLKNPFFGATFAFTLLLMIALAWGPLLAPGRPRRRWLGGLALAAWGLALVPTFMWPVDNSPLSYWHPASAASRNLAKAERLNEAHRELYRAMRAYQSVEHVHVTMNGEGMILTSQLLDYWASRDMTDPWDIIKATYRNDWGDLLVTARYIIVAEQDTDLLSAHLPSSHATEAMLAAVRTLDDVIERGVFPTHTGGRIHLFERISPFTGWHVVEGLHVEGTVPGPEGRRMFRQSMAYQPVSVVAIPGSHPRDVVMEIAATAAGPGQRLEVLLDDELLDTIELPANPDLSDPEPAAWTRQIELDDGPHLLRLRRAEPANQVTFWMLRVLPE